MKNSDLWLFLKKDWQDYVSSLDMMKKNVENLVSDWAEQINILIDGDWRDTLTVHMSAVVVDKISGDKYTITEKQVLRGRKLKKEECTKNGK